MYENAYKIILNLSTGLKSMLHNYFILLWFNLNLLVPFLPQRLFVSSVLLLIFFFISFLDLFHRSCCLSMAGNRSSHSVLRSDFTLTTFISTVLHLQDCRLYTGFTKSFKKFISLVWVSLPKKSNFIWYECLESCFLLALYKTTLVLL